MVNTNTATREGVCQLCKSGPLVPDTHIRTRLTRRTLFLFLLHYAERARNRGERLGSPQGHFDTSPEGIWVGCVLSYLTQLRLCFNIAGGTAL